MNPREASASEDQDYFDSSSEENMVSLKRKFKDDETPVKKVKTDEGES